MRQKENTSTDGQQWHSPIAKFTSWRTIYILGFSIDYMGPLPETNRGNKHILVLMHHYTK
jgi:hypothetical protein